MLPYEFEADRFSRWIAYVLRHNPSRYGLEPDRYGYVDFSAFAELAKRHAATMTLERLREFLIASGAERFEITGNRVRARYGHSIAVEPSGAPITPPEHLYHGTEHGQMAAIQRDGLQPIGRWMIHLSATFQEALAVAGRNTEQPMVVRILAREAHAAGIAFYQEGHVYLAAQVPPQFLCIEPMPSNALSPQPDQP